MKARAFTLLTSVCFMAVIPSAFSSILIVTSSGDSGPGTLRTEVVASNPGDIITFATNLSGTTITLTAGQIEIANSHLNIDASALASKIAISGNNVSRIFQIDAGVQLTINSVILENGNEVADVGGAVKNDGTLSAINCSFQSNVAQGGIGGTPNVGQAQTGGAGGGGAGMGGAIFSDGPSVSLIGCNFNGNTAEGGNGGSGVSIDPVSSPGAGGGPNGGSVYAYGSGQSGGFGGGGSGGALYGGSPFSGGPGGFGGGGGGSAVGPVHAGFGGAAGTYGGRGGTASSSLSGGGGAGAGLGGALFTQTGAIYISNCTFSANSAKPGTAGTYAGNAMGIGGALFITTPSLTLANCSFSGNSASTDFSNSYAMPKLSVTVQSNHNVHLTWPTTEPGFSAQYSSGIKPPLSWHSLGTTIVNQGTYYEQIYSNAPSGTYFRLAHPNP